MFAFHFRSHTGTGTVLINEQTCCATTTAVASITSAVLVGCVSVAIHIALLFYQSKRRKKMKGQASRNSAQDDDAAKIEIVYEEVADKKQGDEVIRMEENQAYSPRTLMK